MFRQVRCRIQCLLGISIAYSYYDQMSLIEHAFETIQFAGFTVYGPFSNGTKSIEFIITPFTNWQMTEGSAGSPDYVTVKKPKALPVHVSAAGCCVLIKWFWILTD